MSLFLNKVISGQLAVLQQTSVAHKPNECYRMGASSGIYSRFLLSSKRAVPRALSWSRSAMKRTWTSPGARRQPVAGEEVLEGGQKGIVVGHQGSGGPARNS